MSQMIRMTALAAIIVMLINSRKIVHRHAHLFVWAGICIAGWLIVLLGKGVI
jgi:hypothetical protein